MKIDVTTRNYNISDHLKEVTEQKLSKLDKYFGGGEAAVKVRMKKEGNSLVTEVMLDYLGKFVRATASSDNFYDNLDVVLPKLEGQIRKHRTRFDKSNSNSAYKDVAVYEGAALAEAKSSKLVKEKKFKLTPMTVAEAMEEMELLGHTFYVFLEAKTNSVQVIYLRNDGDIGLIDPEI